MARGLFWTPELGLRVPGYKGKGLQKSIGTLFTLEHSLVSQYHINTCINPKFPCHVPFSFPFDYPFWGVTSKHGR